ncbi:MAG: hypothetical protein IIB21_06940 [Chloroflexi bacterium]|nr:hypothetical protein [Chloroflexota bacterium]
MKRITMRMMSGDVFEGRVDQDSIDNILRKLKEGTGQSTGVVEFKTSSGHYGMFRASAIESLQVEPIVTDPPAAPRRKSKQK